MSTLTSPTRKQTPKENIERTRAGLVQSQLILFNSRKKWGLLYSLATVAGILCVPGVLGVIAADADILHIIQGIILLPLISLLIATGMYILNDLIDVDLDRANGKKRPIPSGLVSKKQARLFVVSTNGLAIVLTAMTLNPATTMIVIPMLAIGIMYSAHMASLKKSEF